MNAFFWALMAALAWGIVPLIEKWGLVKTDPMVGLFYRCWGVLIGLILLGVFMLKPAEIKSVDIRSVLFLIAGGFLASIVGQFCFYHSLKLGEISRVTPITGSYPLVAFMLGVLFLGESVNLTKICGVLAVMLGVWLLK